MQQLRYADPTFTLRVSAHVIRCSEHERGRLKRSSRAANGHRPPNTDRPVHEKVSQWATSPTDSAL
jgi:hypothetical protein